MIAFVIVLDLQFEWRSNRGDFFAGTELASKLVRGLTRHRGGDRCGPRRRLPRIETEPTVAVADTRCRDAATCTSPQILY
jgi:hypothetical protein